MKFFVFLTVVFLTANSFAQVKIVPANLSYVSKWEYSDLFPVLDTGSKILFRQRCSPELPAEFPNGTIMFENVVLDGNRMAVSIEFRDTLVQTVTYYLTYRQRELLGKIGFQDLKGKSTNRKGEWTYIVANGPVVTSIFADREKIVVIKTVIKKNGTHQFASRFLLLAKEN